VQHFVQLQGKSICCAARFAALSAASIGHHLNSGVPIQLKPLSIGSRKQVAAL